MIGKCCFGLDCKNEKCYILLIIALAAIEACLILAGILPSLEISSLGNTFFSLAQLAVIFCMGWALSKAGMKKVAKKGALAAFYGFAVFFLASIVGFYTGRSVMFGAVQVTVSYYGLFVILAVTLAVNIAIGIAVALLGAFFAMKLKRRK